MIGPFGSFLYGGYHHKFSDFDIQILLKPKGKVYTEEEEKDLQKRLLARTREVMEQLRQEGFSLHPDKTRVARRNARQSVTGIVVNDHPSVPRPLIRRLRAILHNAKKTGLNAQNRADHPHFESWVRGMIAYIEMANPSQGAKLRQTYEGLSS